MPELLFVHLALCDREYRRHFSFAILKLKYLYENNNILFIMCQLLTVYVMIKDIGKDYRYAASKYLV